MTIEALETPVPSALPSLADAITANKNALKSKRPLNERIIYRSSKLPGLGENLEKESYVDHTECPRCHSIISISNNCKNENNNEGKSKSRMLRSKLSNSAASGHSSCQECENRIKTPAVNRAESPKKRSTYIKKGKLYKSVDPNVNWDDLGDKIEDWFEYAKTPDQKVVYHFLKDIKDEKEDDSSTVYSEKLGDKVKSLEDILDNLKKYRHKFQRTGNSKSAVLPQLHGGLTKSNSNLANVFESSTWRVMRSVRSADIRNKYPLPKANPDEYFRNSTVFHVAGRQPRSTFLLHPEWV